MSYFNFNALGIIHRKVVIKIIFLVYINVTRDNYFCNKRFSVHFIFECFFQGERGNESVPEKGLSTSLFVCGIVFYETSDRV